MLLGWQWAQRAVGTQRDADHPPRCPAGMRVTLVDSRQIVGRCDAAGDAAWGLTSQRGRHHAAAACDGLAEGHMKPLE